MSTLWLLMVPVCTAMYTLLLPIAPNDFWYHARAGAEIIATGKVPTVALFSASVAPGTPYFYQSWIAEIALYATLKWGGLAWIIILRAVCLTLSFALLQFAVWRRLQRVASNTDSTTLARLAALSTLLAFGLSASNMDIRPQTFSVPLFCAFVFALYEWPFLAGLRRTIVIAALTLLMMLWANTHGAFFTGLILLAVSLCGELLFAAITRGAKASLWRERLGTALSKQQLTALVLLIVLAILAALINPRGLEIYGYVFLLARDKSSQKFIQEWQTPSFTDWYGALFFLTLFAIIAALFALVRRDNATKQPEKEVENAAHALLQGWGIRFSELLIITALAVMALRDARSIIWFGLFAAPAIGALLTKIFGLGQRSTPHTADEAVPRGVQVVNAIIALLLVSSTLWFLPWTKTSLPLPPEYSKNFAPTPHGEFPIGFSGDPPLLLESNTPVEAVAFLRQNPPRGKLWNDFVFGSYLTWTTLYTPRLAPHVDPRVEMHSLAFWEEYGRVASGAPDASRKLIAAGFSDVLLDAKEQPGLLRQLHSNGWRIIWPTRKKNRKIGHINKQWLPREGAVLLKRM